MPICSKNDQQPSNLKASEYVVLKLMKLYLNKGRNVKYDIFFTSISNMGLERTAN